MLMAAWRGCRDQQSGPGPPKATGIAAAVESSSGQEQEESLRPAAAAGAARAWAGEKGGGGAASPAVASMATALSSSCHSSPLLLEGDDRMEEDHLPQQQQQLLLQPAALLLTPTPAPPSFLVRLAPLPLPSSFARTPPLALSGSSSSKYRVGPTDAAFVFDCCTQGLTVYLERIWRAATVTATAAAVPGVSIQDAQDVIAVEVARALFLTPLPEQYGRSALMAACIGGQAGTLRAVLAMVFGVGARGWAAQQQEKRAVLDRRDEVGATALLLAAAEGHAQVCLETVVKCSHGCR